MAKSAACFSGLVHDICKPFVVVILTMRCNFISIDNLSALLKKSCRDVFARAYKVVKCAKRALIYSIPFWKYYALPYESSF